MRLSSSLGEDRRVTSFGGIPGLVALGVLLVGLGYGAYTDLKSREAPFELWLLLGSAGIVLGLIALWPDGELGLLLWLLVGALVLQHFVPWDIRLEAYSEAVPGILEAAFYVLVGGVIAWSWSRDGLGGSGTPPEVVAVFASVVVARGLFEAKLLYGGADAMALMAAGTLIPLNPPTVFTLPMNAAFASRFMPGPISLLIDAALLTVAIPFILVIRNLLNHEFEGLRSFRGYQIPVEELPHRFVWLNDPIFGKPDPEEESIETNEQEVALRKRQVAELEAKGVRRIWVTPQLPYLVFFFLGAILLAIAGNVLFDLLAIL
jgi:hypothetical protein